MCEVTALNECVCVCVCESVCVCHQFTVSFDRKGRYVCFIDSMSYSIEKEDAKIVQKKKI